MRDIVILAVTTAFFGLCVAYVRWCDHLIGPDDDAVDHGGGRPDTVAAARRAPATADAEVPA